MESGLGKVMSYSTSNPPICTCEHPDLHITYSKVKQIGYTSHVDYVPIFAECRRCYKMVNMEQHRNKTQTSQDFSIDLAEALDI